MKLLMVTGLSGSGKSIALHTLEDLGYYCIDNLPLFLLRNLAQEIAEKRQDCYAKTAVGVDARNQGGDLSALPALVSDLRAQGLSCEIVFLDAQDEILIKRFGETRRKHPLSGDGQPLAEAIARERGLLEPVLNAADLRVDTSHTTQHQLRDLIRLRLSEGGEPRLSVLFQSFGFKHGVPRDADFVFDMRSLPNPYWEQGLRPYTGLDAPVQGFLDQNPRADQLARDLGDFLHRWLPAFESDGRNYLTVAFGCTGGQHRSVYMAERLARRFKQDGRDVRIRHRELS